MNFTEKTITNNQFILQTPINCFSHRLISFMPEARLSHWVTSFYSHQHSKCILLKQLLSFSYQDLEPKVFYLIIIIVLLLKINFHLLGSLFF